MYEKTFLSTVYLPYLGEIMKKVGLMVMLLCASLAQAEVIVEANCDGEFCEQVILTQDHPTEMVQMGEELYRIVLNDETIEEGGAQLVRLEVYTVTEDQEELISKPEIKRNNVEEPACVTVSDDEHTMTLTIQ